MELGFVANMYQTNNGLFHRATDSIPAERWLASPGDDSNHLTWITGHMLVTRLNVLRMLGSDWSAPWEKLFVRGAKRVSNEQYPQPEEIRKAWTEVEEKLVIALSGARPETLAKSAKEGSPSFDGTIGGLIAFLSLHETYHAGQIGYLRKWLGFGDTVG